MSVFSEVCKASRDGIKDEAAWLKNRLQYCETRSIDEIEALQKASIEFLTEGMINLSNRPYLRAKVHGIGWGHMGFRWYRYIRDLAKEHNRPLVYYYMRGPGWGACIFLPYRVYIRPLLGPFLLADESLADISHNSVRWRIAFSSGDGMTLFDQWRDQCKINPEFRKVLRIP